MTDTPERILFDSTSTEPDDLPSVVYQAVGAGSVCWESMAGTGTFQDDRAAAVAREAVGWIEQHYQPKPALLAIDSDPEMFHGLTVWTHEGVSVQIRETGVALHVGHHVPRSTEDDHPAILTLGAARKIRDLLNVATARGAL